MSNDVVINFSSINISLVYGIITAVITIFTYRSNKKFY